MERKKSIALDVDGVLLDFMPAFDETAAKVLKKQIIVDTDNHGRSPYDLCARAGCDIPTIEHILQTMIDEGVYGRLEPLNGVSEALEAIKNEGFYIHLVTAIPEKARDLRLSNLLEKLNFIPDEIHCVGMGKAKAEVLSKINPDVFIDDRVDYLASAPQVVHLVWCDQRELQKDEFSLVDVHVHSLLEWTQVHMPRIVKRLDHHYFGKNPVQGELKLESPARKYNSI